MKSNPPPASEAPVLEKLKAIGIVPGEKFDPSTLDPAVAKGLEQSVQAALAKLEAASKETGAPVNGWRVPPMVLGNFGTDYGARAVVALIGLGANLPQDAVYPSAFVDGAGQPLDGANRYELREAVHDHVGAELDRRHDQRREGVVDDEHRTVPVGDVREPRDVGDSQGRVRHGFAIEDPGARRDGALHRCEIRDVHERRRDPSLRGQVVIAGRRMCRHRRCDWPPRGRPSRRAA